SQRALCLRLFAEQLRQNLLGERKPSKGFRVRGEGIVAERPGARAVIALGFFDDALGFVEVTGERPLRLGRVLRAVLELAGAIRQVREAHRGRGPRLAGLPLPGREIEAIEREQLVSVVGDEGDRVENELKNRLGNEVVEVYTYPARLHALHAGEDGALEAVRRLRVDAEQTMSVRPGARAAAARLDA